MSEQDLEQIELSLEHAKLSIDNMKALNTLSHDKNFVKLITEGYFRDEASRLVLLKADNSMQKEEHQATIEKSIIAVGYFRQYLSTIYQLGNMAEKAMADDEITREEIQAEELEDAVN